MGSGRATFLAGFILGGALGLPAGHLLWWNRPSLQPADANAALPLPSATLADDVSFQLGLPLEELPPEYSFLDQPAPEPNADSPLKNAIAVESNVDFVEPTASNIEQAERQPEPVSEPAPIQVAEAEPLADRIVNENAFVRELIEAELKDVPAGQREIWYESLKDLNEQDVTGVLRMWKLFGGPAGGLPASLMPVSPAVTSPGLAPIPADQPALPPAAPGAEYARDAGSPVPLSVTEMKTSLVGLLKYNMAHGLRTPGHQQLLPVFEDTLIDGCPQITAMSVEVISTQGELRETGELFDLAIEQETAGPLSFFHVVSETGEHLLTRDGRFHRDDDGKLCLKRGDQKLRLSPTVQIPFNVSSVEIEPSGRVVSADDQTELGTIELAQRISARALIPVGDGLYRYAPGADTIQHGPANADAGESIRQGHLEYADFEHDDIAIVFQNLIMTLSIEF